MRPAVTEPHLDTWRMSDGYVGRVRRWLPVGTPRGHLVCLHGIQSHGGWYDGSSRFLCDRGFAVHWPDRRGSGLNQQDRGDAPGFRRLLDDVADYVRTLGPVPVTLVAVSWGGKLGAAVLRRHPGLVQRLALLCPGFCPQVRPPLGQRLGIAWARLTRPAQLFPVPLNDPALFTASERWQRFIAEDPLALHEATARLLVESVRLDGYLRFVPRHVRVPVLLMLGGRDRIIDNRRTRAYVGRFATADRTVIEYPDAHHTLEFEPDPGVFLNDLAGWLEGAKPQAAQG